MTSVEAHIENARELIRDIEEKLRAETAVKRQKIVGFACSEASCDLLAVLLHKKNLIDPGFNVNHRFFSSLKKAGDELNFAFPSKDALLPLLVEQDKYRTLLCYGKSKDDGEVSRCIAVLFEVKKIVEKETGEKI